MRGEKVQVPEPDPEAVREAVELEEGEGVVEEQLQPQEDVVLSEEEARAEIDESEVPAAKSRGDRADLFCVKVRVNFLNGSYPSRVLAYILHELFTSLFYVREKPNVDVEALLRRDFKQFRGGGRGRRRGMNVRSSSLSTYFYYTICLPGLEKDVEDVERRIEELRHELMLKAEQKVSELLAKFRSILELIRSASA